jgi:4-hydroxy-3-methylbut-2-enyl diphosphate reductase
MAIEAVERAAGESRSSGSGELPVYHSIVHNDTVVERLESSHGVHFVEDLGELESLREELRSTGRKLDDAVVFSAHGVSPAVREQAAALGLAAIDATCPLVTKVHSEAKRYAREGYHILLVGDSTSHQEVIGTRGEAPEATTVVGVLGNKSNEAGLADARTVTVPDPDRVVVLTQTTLSIDDTNRTIELLRERFPRLVQPSRDDLCYATKNRQDAVREIAPLVDLFLVVTSSRSSNGMRLLELAHDLSGNARRIESVRDIDQSWLHEVSSIGLTSAASTPDDLVQEVVEHFRATNPRLELIERGEWEDIAFRPAKRVPAQVNP